MANGAPVGQRWRCDADAALAVAERGGPSVRAAPAPAPSVPQRERQHPTPMQYDSDIGVRRRTL